MVKIVDTHVHSWNLKKVNYSWLTDKESVLYRDFIPKDLEPLLQEIGVKEGILVQADNSYEDSHYMFEQSKETDWITGVVAWLPLTDPDESFATLDKQYTHEPFFKGIRHLMHIETNDQWILQPKVIESLKLLAHHKIPFDAIGVNLQQLRSIVLAAEKLPDLNIVIDHLNQPPLDNTTQFKGWSEIMQEASRHRNMYVKISGLGNIKRPNGLSLEESIKPSLDFVLSCFEISRIFCGGDWPISLLDRDYTSTWRAYIQTLQSLTTDPTTVESITYTNAKSFYNT